MRRAGYLGWEDLHGGRLGDGRGGDAGRLGRNLLGVAIYREHLIDLHGNLLLLLLRNLLAQLLSWLFLGRLRFLARFFLLRTSSFTFGLSHVFGFLVTICSGFFIAHILCLPIFTRCLLRFLRLLYNCLFTHLNVTIQIRPGGCNGPFLFGLNFYLVLSQ